MVCVSGVSSTVVVLGVLLVGVLLVGVLLVGVLLLGVLLLGVLLLGVLAGRVLVCWRWCSWCGVASVCRSVLLHETLRQLSPNATALTVTRLLSVGRKRFSLRAGVALASIGVLQGIGSRVDDERGG